MPDQHSTAAARLGEVQARIARAASIARRSPAEIELVAVSKFQPPEAISALQAAGQAAFGENRVQEAQLKWPPLRRPGDRLHLVGQLQSNKAAEAVALFDVLHSVDRSSLVVALARAIDRAGRAPTLLAQVNIGNEAQKGGCPIVQLPGLLDQARHAGLVIEGLMAVPPAATEPAPYFALLAKLARDHGLPRLSIGMSGDYETAVMLGATIVRVGTALFGDRVA
jgi:PLP dependent protein